MKVSSKISNVLIEVACMLFILLFSYAAVSKLLDFETFETQLGQSPLLSAYAEPVAIGVPFFELFIALGLMIPRFRLWALFGFYGMMVMFTTYIYIILNFSDFVPCSCGGVLEAMGWAEHLIFNGAFILLSGLSIWILSNKKIKTLLILGVLTIFSVGIVTVLFLSSEKQIKRNNAFQRRYIPHPIEKIGEYDLEYNSYYIAGIDDKIYLGNFTTPLFMYIIDTSLTKVNQFHVTIDSTHLPYQRMRLSVMPPYFYLGDGTVPILFRGNINKLNATVFSYYDAYFNEYLVIDSENIGITTKSTAKRTRTLGVLKKTNNTIILTLNDDILERLNYGTFDSDGILLWNDAYKKFIYTYYYRNSYEIADQYLTHQAKGKTIDTISKPILDIAYYSSNEKYKLGGKSILVNRQSATHGDYLYIHSDRLGRYESEDTLRSASIIDVYNIIENTYVFSFYLYHQSNKKLSEFRVHKNLLIAIVEDKLWLYRLKPEHFGSPSNSKHTAQYQE